MRFIRQQDKTTGLSRLVLHSENNAEEGWLHMLLPKGKDTVPKIYFDETINAVIIENALNDGQVDPSESVVRKLEEEGLSIRRLVKAELETFAAEKGIELSDEDKKNRQSVMRRVEQALAERGETMD